MRTAHQQQQVLRKAKSFKGALNSTRHWLHTIGQRDSDAIEFDTIEGMIEYIEQFKNQDIPYDGRQLSAKCRQALKAIGVKGEVKIESAKAKVLVPLNKTNTNTLQPHVRCGRTIANDLAWQLLDLTRCEVISHYGQTINGQYTAVVEMR